jgi:DNA-binding SARP family transcriptional activator
MLEKSWRRAVTTRAENSVQLCGKLVVRLAGERAEDRIPGRQGRLLFAYLVVHRTTTVDHEAAVEAIWQSSPPSAPNMALRALLSKLRNLGEEIRVDARGGLRVHLPPGTFVDLEAAREAIHSCEAALRRGDWDHAYSRACVARYISARPFLKAEDAPWIDEVRRELEDIHLCALEGDAAASIEIGGAEVPVAARTARRLIEAAPFREHGYRLLMRALAMQGRAPEALIVFDQLRTFLREELGANPSRETLDLHQQLLGSCGAG